MKKLFILLTLSILAIAALWGPHRISPMRTASAQGGGPTPDPCTDRARCDEVSPLIPMHSSEAIHMGLVWKRKSETPKLLFHSRFPEYTPNDVAYPELVDLA